MKKFLLILALIIEVLILLFSLTIGLYLYFVFMVLPFEYEFTVDFELLSYLTKITLFYGLSIFANITAIKATYFFIKDKPVPKLNDNTKFILTACILYLILDITIMHVREWIITTF